MRIILILFLFLTSSSRAHRAEKKLNSIPILCYLRMRIDGPLLCFDQLPENMERGEEHEVNLHLLLFEHEDEDEGKRSSEGFTNKNSFNFNWVKSYNREI